MFGKYNDMPAAVALGIFLLGALFYDVQTIFMTESWLAAREFPVETVPVARVMGVAFLGLTIGLLLTFVEGPDGQKIFFVSALVAQVGTVLTLWHGHLIANAPNLLPDAVIVSVLLAFLTYGYVRLKHRL